ncbi:uncharacterized protein LOC125494769 [Beta vulgaris subsp. vulgaris]|uniref:uncharacterized protein LOC125494769 n=1 Tax=Beta vulgaris subsp. vulgaris TaxID=3555 RepID=UPI0020375C6E|nr:uncharacterized protein LOC125494769 [Beta vulgaris subsp. vulgaris]
MDNGTHSHSDDFDISMDELLEMEENCLNTWRLDEEISMGELLHLQEAMNNYDDEDEENAWYVSDSDNEDETQNQILEPNQIGNKKPVLVNELRQQLVVTLFSEAENFVLPRGLIKEMTLKYHKHRTIIFRIWNEAKKQKQQGLLVNVRHKKRNCGRKSMITDDEVLRAVPLRQRTTLRSFAAALEGPIFDLLYNVVHVDEKWFFMSKVTQRFYLLSEEADPYRACQSKSFIPKVMFMGGIARPIISESGHVLFDGKIGIFPFVEDYITQRNSVNRDRGPWELRAKQSITKDVIRDMIIEVLLPAIKSNWPEFGCKQIWVQQDNARPHIKPDDEAFLQAASTDGFDIHLVYQPPQSPDLNLLDLGFFKAIQSIQHTDFPETIEELLKSVQVACEAYDPKTLNYTWLHFMYVMFEVLKVEGGNNYKNPRKGKKKLDRMGQLPTFVEVSQELVDDTIALLNVGIVTNPTGDLAA